MSVRISDTLTPGGYPQPKLLGSIGKYVIEKEIGKGSFAIVYRGHLASNTSRPVAIKAISKQKLKNRKLLENLEVEISILRNIKHGHIVSLFDCERTDQKFYLIMEYCALGDLTCLIKGNETSTSDHPILSRLFETYPSPNTRERGLHHAFTLNFLQQLASALKFLRSRNLVHRDIKPQNLLLSLPRFDCENSHVFHDAGYVGIYNFPILKVADFGFARFLPNASMADTLCGSPLYMAPEILNCQKYDAKVDLWSAGAVLFEMCCGRPPFRATNHIELYRKIKRNKDRIIFPPHFDSYDNKRTEYINEKESDFHEINACLKDLIQRLMTFDPTKRMNFGEFFTDRLVNFDLSLFELKDVASRTLWQPNSKEIIKGSIFASDLPPTGPKLPLSPITIPPTSHSSQQQVRQQIGTGFPTGARNVVEGDKKGVISRLAMGYGNFDQGTASEMTMDTGNSPTIKDDYVMVDKAVVQVNEMADKFEFANLASKPSFKTRLKENLLSGMPIFEPRILPNGNRRKPLGKNPLNVPGTSSNEFNQPPPSRVPQNCSPIISGSQGVFDDQSDKSSSIFNDQLFQYLARDIPLRLSEDYCENEGGPPISYDKLDDWSIRNLSNGELLLTLERLCVRIYVLLSFAEVKYSQAATYDGFIRMGIGTWFNRHKIAQEKEQEVGRAERRDYPQYNTKSIESDLRLHREAMVLFSKALSIINKVLRLSSLWWDVFSEGRSCKESYQLPRLNLMVQWAREKYNICTVRVEDLQLKILEHTTGVDSVYVAHNYPEKGSVEEGDVVLEQLLYDRALGLSRSAAEIELGGESLEGCELLYATAIWMLDIALDNEKSDTDSALDDQDQKIIKGYIQSISHRLKRVVSRSNSYSSNSE